MDGTGVFPLDAETRRTELQGRLDLLKAVRELLQLEHLDPSRETQLRIARLNLEEAKLKSELPLARAACQTHSPELATTVLTRALSTAPSDRGLGWCESAGLAQTQDFRHLNSAGDLHGLFEDLSNAVFGCRGENVSIGGSTSMPVAFQTQGPSQPDLAEGLPQCSEDFFSNDIIWGDLCSSNNISMPDSLQKTYRRIRT